MTLIVRESGIKYDASRDSYRLARRDIRKDIGNRAGEETLQQLLPLLFAPNLALQWTIRSKKSICLAHRKHCCATLFF